MERTVTIILRWLASCWFELPEDFLTYSHFRRVLENVEMRSSPGVPLLFYGSTNGALLKNTDGTWNESRVQMIWMMVQEQMRVRQSHPIRLFVKPEPHKKSKLEQGRFRLIYSVSLIDTLIDQMLFSSFSDVLMKRFCRIFTMVGWSPYEGGWRLIDQKGFGYDKSAWEYTAPKWLFDVALDVIEALNLRPDQSTCYGTWRELARWRFQELFGTPEFQLTNGMRFRQCVQGLMKSGTFLTILLNSIGQAIVEVSSSLEAGVGIDYLLKAMGDDTIQPKQIGPEQLKRIEEYGILIKEPEIGEFCGMKFVGGNRVEPVYRGKHLANLRVLDDLNAVETLQSYQLLYGKSEWLPRLREIIWSTYPDAMMPDNWIREIFDGVA